MRTASYFVTGLLLLICVGCIGKGRPLVPSSSGGPEGDPLTAKQILESVADTYAKCESYRDTGLVKVLFIESDHSWTDEKPFSTAFVRPDRFRFEYRFRMPILGGREYRHIVWCNGKDVRTWSDITTGTEQEASLLMAVARATGVSNGSALTIPALLLPDELTARRLTDLTKPKRAKDADIGQIKCYRIQGKWGDCPATVWIEKRTFLVRRIDYQHRLGESRAENTTTYEPTINAGIDDKMLEFDPPKQE